jgi:cytochrome c peroxidase
MQIVGIPMKLSFSCPSLRLPLLVVLLGFGLGGLEVMAAGGRVRLVVEPTFAGAPLSLDLPLERKGLPGVSVSRLDLLLSGLALKKENGTWLESAEWFALISAGKGLLRADADGVTAENFTAIRFNVGLPSDVDHGNPNRWEVGHALHPAQNGLHWGWLGGYVFTALEGHCGEAGYSYHLAGATCLRQVELPVEFQGGGPVTIRVGLDVSRWIGDLDLAKVGLSTHSREGDALAAQLADRTVSAFSVRGVAADVFHELAPALAEAVPAGTTPFALQVTERFPKPILPKDNPLTAEGVALGQRLFEDVRLSRVQTQSCANCHLAERGFADDKTVAIGAEGQVGRRNAMALVNLAWRGSFFWDGRAPTLREQVLMPVQDAHEMNAPLDLVVTRLQGDQTYRAQFKEAFGGGDIRPNMIAKALEQYLLTLLAQDSKFDRALRKLTKLSPSEARGLQLFVTEHDPVRGLRGADCFHCHGGMLFTDDGFHNNGLATKAGDTGRMGVTGNAADHGKFKTPSLRNIALTAPYMHDGRFATLEEVVDHYSSGVVRSETLDPNLAKHPAVGLQLTATEKADLVAFLKTLTDEPLKPTRELTLAQPSLK